MIDHEARIRALVRDTLKKAALGELIGFSITNTFMFMPTPTGEAMAGPAWMVTVTMRNPELGGRDIAKPELIPGAMPTDATFEKAAKSALEKCRTDKAAILRGEKVDA